MSVVVFDLDHTLTVSDHLPRLWYEVLEGWVEPQVIERCFAATIGMSAHAMIQACLPQASAELVERLQKDTFEWNRQNARYELMPGAQPLLEALVERGDRLVLSTGKRRESGQQVLDDLGVADYFELVLGCRAGFEKTQHLEQVVERYALQGESLAQATAVGDGQAEMAAAAAVGLGQRIGITTGPCSEQQLQAAGATLVVGDLEGVAGVLGVL